MPLSRTKAMFERALAITPGGVHSNIRYFEPYPLYLSKARGSRLWDLDGTEYIDCIVNFGACILGHGHPSVVESVKTQLDSGLTCGAETQLSVEVSEKLTKMIPCAEAVRFASTGTEAVMHILMIARGYTGRDKILKIEGGFNGWYDSVLVGTSPSLNVTGSETASAPALDSAGIPKNATQNTMVVPYNNAEALSNVVEKHRNELAAVILEPIAFNMGCVLPKDGYLKSVRKITEENDVLLIFDEVITGFRVAPGGAQQYFGITPDLATFAKAVANGFPLSVVAGKREIMQVSRPGGKVAYMGRYNGSQAPLAAASATLEILRDGRVQEQLKKSTDKLQNGFSQICKEVNVVARLEGMAGQFQVHFADEEMRDYRRVMTVDRKRFMKFQKEMLRQGILFLPKPLFHHGVSAAHNDEDIDSILTAMRNLSS